MENQRIALFNGSFLKELAAASVAFFLAALAPYVGAAFLVFVPLMISYYHAPDGRAISLAVIIPSLIIVLLALQALRAYYNLPMILILVFIGVVIAEILKNNYTIEKTLSLSVASIFAISAIFMLYQGFVLKETPWNLIGGYIDKKIRYTVDLYTTLNAPSDQIALIKDNLPEIIAMITRIFPALFLISLIFLVWVNLLAIRFIFNKYGLPSPDFGDLSNWKAPEKMVWYLIAAGIMLLLPDERTEIAGWNILVAVLFIYLLAGLAVISFFLKKSSVPSVFRYLIYFLVFVQQFVTMLVIAAGLFDLWADFRKLNSKAEEDSA